MGKVDDDLIQRLKNAHENSQQRIMGSNIFEEAATALEAKDAEIARLKDGWNDCISDLTAAQKRISDLERQLAEETERCARVADSIAENAVQTGSKWIGHQAIPNAIAAAIRGGAK